MRNGLRSRDAGTLCAGIRDCKARDASRTLINLNMPHLESIKQHCPNSNDTVGYQQTVSAFYLYTSLVEPRGIEWCFESTKDDVRFYGTRSTQCFLSML